jgi:16S rRNA G966 N2-methylase RsmD
MTTTEFSRIISGYENSLATSKRKADGIFYTDLSLAEKIIRELAVPSDAIVLDPCCGTGSFNYAAVRYGVQNVYGADIDKNAIGLCTSSIPQGKFVATNSIEIDSHILFSKLAISEKADYVVGNPPYAKWSPSKLVSSSFNRKVVGAGNNLFIAGLIRAMELVKDGGIISYIIPKNFLHVAAYSALRKEILETKTIISIIDIGTYFKNVRGEQIVLTLRNALPDGNKFAIKKMACGLFVKQMDIEQAFFCDEILLFKNETDFKIFNKLVSYDKLETICTGYIGRGRSSGDSAIVGKEVRKFGYKNTPTPATGNQIFIQNIYSAEAGIIAAFGGNLAATQTVTILTDGNEKMCRFILGILHSKLCNFFLYRYCYNYSKLTMHTDAKYLRKVPLPSISEDLLDKIVGLVALLEQEDYMTEKWFSHIRNLDATIYDAFALSGTEREYIDSEMKFVQSNKWS